ncbi:MAG: hypothetical protein Ta2G_12390 [Termitinemataceae bacterium]|nr:MAG: hypothetical protein Ta2G_12390 [Termitinemataceae bacterium]
MIADAHCHPYYLKKVFADCEVQRQSLNIICAASAWNKDDWAYIQKISNNEEIKTGCRKMILCFAVHPQMCALYPKSDVDASLYLLHQLLSENSLDAIGESGFDFFNTDLKNTEELQSAIFEEHLDLAIKYKLPLVLHIRRSMQKIFSYKAKLKRVPSIVFHSFSGTLDEAQFFLRSGINAYFSFGTAIMLNHKAAIKCCSHLDSDRILFETDAPYQMLKGEMYSSYCDIKKVIQSASVLRGSSVAELEKISCSNFFNAFGMHRKFR